MKITCNIIEDLLPLYIDDMVSEDSRQLVEEHLKECAACRKMLDEMKKRISCGLFQKMQRGIQTTVLRLYH